MLVADLLLECQGKLVYANAAEAQRALGRIRRRTHGKRSDVHAYRCRDCGAWHLGRQKRLHHERA